ncbi:MAG: hypothetical protein HQL22_09925 [Candidatus Omnitrophica bacterium]|nr:hypothetical protein [Candidatus Omnitrophota bacterium]
MRRGAEQHLSFYRLGWCIVWVLLSALAWLHLAGRIDLVTADLGRHLKNGELFLSEGRILTTNYYSFSRPDFPALCHHWGIGPVFYLVWKAWGFMGLSWGYTALLFVTFLLAVLTARCSSWTGAAVLAGILALPLLGYRIEIRPEGVSTFFLMIEYFVLSEWRARRITFRALWVIPLIQLVWVNVHILFFCGLALVCIFWIDEGLVDGSFKGVMGGVLAACLAASLVSPFTIAAVLVPLTIFSGYGYDLVENQNILFMLKRFSVNPVYGYFLAALSVSLLLVVIRMAREKTWRRAFPHLLMALFFGLLAVKAVRSIAMFGFILIPVAAESLGVLTAGLPDFWRMLYRRVIAGFAVGLVMLAALVPPFYLSPVRKFVTTLPPPGEGEGSLFSVLMRPSVWGGLQPGTQGSAVFFKNAGLKGPVFNNYDIGGYLIFNLFPDVRPFVDNRPEAYPVDFFKRTYIPMQEDDRVWDEMARRYGFELIYFYRRDATPWAQPFLIRRLNDARWAPVFVDEGTIIMARRNGVNQAAISLYELPRTMFRVTGK